MQAMSPQFPVVVTKWIGLNIASFVLLTKIYLAVTQNK